MPISLPHGQETPEGRAGSLPPQALAGEPHTVEGATHSGGSLVFIQTLALLFPGWKNLGKSLNLLCEVEN